VTARATGEQVGDLALQLHHHALLAAKLMHRDTGEMHGRRGPARRRLLQALGDLDGIS
jgi:hypothetical protein